MSSSKIFVALLIVSLVVAAAAEPAGTPDLAPTMGSRKLMGFGNNGLNRGSNTLRSQAATSQAIQEAVDSGANKYSTKRAGRVGSVLTFAAAQNDQDTFDLAENLYGH